MITKYPFLFYLPKKNDLGGVHSKSVERDTWIVKIAQFDYSPYHCKWMGDDLLGDLCLVPDVDLAEDTKVFYSEQEALQFIKEWWMKQ